MGGDGLIRIRRGRQYFGMLRKLLVVIDGSRVGFVRWNRAAEFLVPAGSHFLQVGMDWCRSDPYLVDMRAGEQLEIDVSIPGNVFECVFEGFARPGQFFRLERGVVDGWSAKPKGVDGLPWDDELGTF